MEEGVILTEYFTVILRDASEKQCENNIIVFTKPWGVSNYFLFFHGPIAKQGDLGKKPQFSRGGKEGEL